MGRGFPCSVEKGISPESVIRMFKGRGVSDDEIQTVVDSVKESYGVFEDQIGVKIETDIIKKSFSPETLLYSSEKWFPTDRDDVNYSRFASVL